MASVRRSHSWALVFCRHPWPGMDNTWSAIFHIAKTTTGPPLPDSCSDDARDFLADCFRLDPKERPSASEVSHCGLASGTLFPFPHCAPPDCFRLDPKERLSACEVSGCGPACCASPLGLFVPFAFHHCNPP